MTSAQSARRVQLAGRHPRGDERGSAAVETPILATAALSLLLGGNDVGMVRVYLRTQQRHVRVHAKRRRIGQHGITGGGKFRFQFARVGRGQS